jgi:predicted RNA-binding protein YlxR (DUF448 family)
MAEKKIPIRKCLGCGEGRPKKELIRVVKSNDGELSIDLTGKKNGRGAYICRTIDCFNKARRARRFERTFQCSIPEEVYDCLGEELEPDDKKQ